MDIRAADRGGRNLHDAIARVDDLRIIDSLHVDVAFSHPDERLHFRPFRGRCGPPTDCPSVVGISPASISALKRRNALYTCSLAESRVSFANAAASFPPGGLYSSATVTSVPSSPGASSKRTDPAF